MLAGFFVNGPYALITTAVSADLGTHESLQVRTRPRVAYAALPAFKVYKVYKDKAFSQELRLLPAFGD